MVGTLKPRWSVLFPASLDSLEREAGQVLDNFFHAGNAQSGWHAAASLWEEEGQWCVEVDLPGVSQEDLDITLEKNSLRITAERKGPEDRKYWHQERTYGRFERVITLPETVNPDGIEAQLKDGVLSLVLAKRPELQPKKIAVKAN